MNLIHDNFELAIANSSTRQYHLALGGEITAGPKYQDTSKAKHNIHSPDVQI